MEKNSVLLSCIENSRNDIEFSEHLLLAYLYLIDWKNIIENNNSITKTPWYFNSLGVPYGANLCNNKTGEGVKNIFSERELKNISFTINALKNKKEQEIFHLVFSTYPSIISKPYDEVDLKKCASNYTEIKRHKSA